jgi:type VI secretion system protein ImpM
MEKKFGAFGKLPALGDFLRMDLPQGFIDPWDRWLQQGVLNCRESLGEAWQDCYFSAPIWRFNLCPGLVGAAPVMGVMMSSVDRVGRQFPLTLAMPMPDDHSPLLDHFLSVPTFEALDEVALAALEDDMTRDILKERLRAVPMPMRPSHMAITEAQGGLVVTGAGPGVLVPELAAALTAGKFRKPSVWSAETEDGMRMMVCEGLPAAGQMIGLFDMNAQVWQKTEAE